MCSLLIRYVKNYIMLDRITIVDKIILVDRTTTDDIITLSIKLTHNDDNLLP